MGADHGLETDPFNAGEVQVRKGPASLLYGSDAMGGTIEVKQLPLPVDNMVFGEVMMLGKSVNSSLGGSLLLGVKKNRWYSKVRYSEQHFRDYRLPADTIVYLTQKIPVYNRRLKNTAGFERHANLHTQYRAGAYRFALNVSNSYQKSGFFPGAHGLPDASRVQDDGDSGNIDMPYSRVNHFKASVGQQYMWSSVALQWDTGYQRNHREEWSLFHTHYDSQPRPEIDPNKELAFTLNTYSSTMRVRSVGLERWEFAAAWDIQYQDNGIGGYSFLLPAYNRFTTGVSAIATYTVNSSFTLSGGIRYDYGRMNVKSFFDPYLEVYLLERGHSAEVANANALRSLALDKGFGDYSASLGFVWQMADSHLMKGNVGRSFRLPGANELASNGVHHGTFRHEQGDPSLKSEQGWQADVAYIYRNDRLSVTVSPFVSWFSNYIYLRPSGEWSLLPHAGQVYRYTGAEALFAGGELAFELKLARQLSYHAAGDYVYTYNIDRKVPLSFSPPATVRHSLEWKTKVFKADVEHQFIARQNRVAQNEDRTPGAHLFNATISFDVPVYKSKAEVTVSARNLLNKRYYNHLSFYRRVEIPEPGRNFQVMIKVPFSFNN